MGQKKLWPVITTIVAAAAAFVLDRIIWPDLPDVMQPSSAQIPFLMGVAAIEAIGFGIAVAFLIFGWKLMRGRSTKDWLVFFSIAWSLGSWWPHDNLHRTMHMGDYNQLIRIEYGFHFTLILAAVIIAKFAWKQWSASQQNA